MFFLSDLIVLTILGIGCGAPLSAEKAEDPRAAESLWEKGQKAMRAGQLERAIHFYKESLETFPGLSRSHLSLGAVYLELGELGQACIHLARYIAVRPGEIAVRSHYAELLLRLGRKEEACFELEQCVAFAQDQGARAYRTLIHCHTRLMEIAEAEEDSYAEHLHRGIGLYLLARESAAMGEADYSLGSESLFCKAAGELTLALSQRPDEARPSWYLHNIWSRLGQRQPASRCLQQASAAAPFSFLTPNEQTSLHLASQARTISSRN